MTIKTYAVVSGGVVTNVCLWDGNTESWQPPEDAIAVEVTEGTGTAYIGFAFAGGQFTAPPQPKTAA